MIRTLKATVASIALLAFAMPSSAALLTFDGGPLGTGTAVGTATNWDPDQIPTASDDLVIGAAFSTSGNLGGGGTQANSVLLQGSHSSTWGLVAWIIDGGSVTLGGGGVPFGGAGDANLTNNGSMTFTAKTASEVVSQYADDISVDGAASVFGSDPLVQEVGDNAYMVENGSSGGDNVTVFMVFDEDTDGDGLPDVWEIHYFGNLDRDGTLDYEPDGLTEMEEYLLDTDPVNADSDGDTLLDGAEVTAGTNPLSDDTDNDGLKDNVETGTGTYVSPTDTGTDPLNANTDGDRFKDGGEVAKGTDPHNASDQPDLPNVIFILADDLGYGEVGVYGQTKILTPSLDALAGGGMRFTDMYAPTAVCAPTRGQLLTGKHAGQCFVRNNRDIGGRFQFPLPEGAFTLGNLMRNAGYSTSCIGKWGLGSPTDGAPWDFGFDHFFGYLSQWQAHHYYPGYLYRNDTKAFYNPTDAALAGATLDIPGANNNAKIDRDNDGNVHSHDAMSKEALEWITAHQDEAFFMYLAFPIPHTSIQPPAHIDDLSDGDGIVFDNTVRTAVEEFYPGQPFGTPIYHAGSADYTPTDDKRHEYAAMITAMDRDIGRILDLLTSLGLRDNTLVVFTSDNGTTFLGEVDYAYFDSVDGLLGLKNSTHEGGIREPFIAAWPGHIPAGTTSGLIGLFDDIMPTLSELTGIPHPADVTGRSILPTLLGRDEDQVIRSHLYWEFSSDGGWSRAVRAGDLKLMRVLNKTTGDTISLELFDLVADRAETTNLAGNPAYADDVERLQRFMDSSHSHNSDFFRPTDEFQIQSGVVVSALGNGVLLEGTGHGVSPFAEVVGSNFTIKAELLTQSVAGLNNRATFGIGATTQVAQMLTVEADGSTRQLTLDYLGETASLAYPAEFPTAGTVSVEIEVEPAFKRVTLHAGSSSVVHTFSTFPAAFGYYAYIVDNARAGFQPLELVLPLPAEAELKLSIAPYLSTMRATYQRTADLGTDDICESSTDLMAWTTERPIRIQPRNQFGGIVDVEFDIPPSITEKTLFLRALVE